MMLFLFLPRKFLDVPQSTILIFGKDHCLDSVCMKSIREWIRPFLIWLWEVFGCAIFSTSPGQCCFEEKML